MNPPNTPPGPASPAPSSTATPGASAIPPPSDAPATPPHWFSLYTHQMMGHIDRIVNNQPSYSGALVAIAMLIGIVALLLGFNFFFYRPLADDLNVWILERKIEESAQSSATRFAKTQNSGTERIVQAVNSNTEAVKDGNEKVLNIVTGSTKVISDTIKAESQLTRNQDIAFNQAMTGYASGTTAANQELGNKLASAQKALEEMKKAAEEQLALARAQQKPQTPPPGDSPPPLPTNPPSPAATIASTASSGLEAQADGQQGVSAGRSQTMEKVRRYTYAAGKESKPFCRKKFFEGKVVLFKKAGSTTTMWQHFDGPGFSSANRKPMSSAVPEKGNIPTFDDAVWLTFVSSGPIMIEEQ